MCERLSWQEIQRRYPRQFVYLEDVEWSPANSTTVLSAVVAYASDQPDDDYQARTIRGEFYQKYTALGATLQMGALMV